MDGLEYLTVEQIATRLGIQRRQVMNLAAKHHWPRRRLYGKRMVYGVTTVLLDDRGDGRRRPIEADSRLE
ncbi:hypothetical protein [Sinorhizobium chiapasense]|uniref:Helix-turn-helix domain-containing protein n=1 Tax=Sinorhizobium chiapasense TaxID=501572 RepID=A0ABZ2BCL1_9HYPH